MNLGVATARALRTAAVATLLAGGCHSHEHDGHHHHGEGSHHHGDDKAHGGGHGHDHDGPPPESRTTWATATTAFVEFPPLVRGEKSAFAAHLTWREDWRPVDAGTLTVTLSGGGAPEERFSIAEVSQPGIFRPVVIPVHVGTRTLVIQLETAGAVERHALGEVTVAKTKAAVKTAEEEEEAGIITLLLEQQWKVDFRVAQAESRSIREGFSVYGRVREVPDGVTEVRAPVGGRLMAPEETMPSPGATVRRDQILASVLPMVDPADSDKAGLERSRDEARARSRWAKGEVDRLKGLVKEGAASARRLSEAHLALEEARAARRAAEQRLERLQAVQSAEGDEAAAITIRAPHDGRVRLVHARPGAYVSAEQPLLEVVDPSRRVVELDVPEVEAARLGRIQGARVEITGQDRALEFTAADRIDTPLGVDDARHTIPLWWSLGDAASGLPPGLAVRAQLWTEAPSQRVALPRAAVIWDAGQSVVYVQVDGENFKRRMVRLGPQDGDTVSVLEGVVAGESVVVEGPYLLKLASLAESAPDHGHAH